MAKKFPEKGTAFMRATLDLALIYTVVSSFTFAGPMFAESGPGKSAVDFGRDVRPILETHCIGCHGPDQQMNGFRLDRRRDAMKGGTGAMIGPGNSAGSRIYLKLIGTEFGPQMPPDGPLATDEIDVIRRWIDQGAQWPDALSGETPSTMPDPQAATIMEALRRGDRAAFLQLLRDDPHVANRQGPGGSTPLMYATLYGDSETVRLLLRAGADPNARNDAGATALMWAMDDLDKTRLLLRHRAEVNARSHDGRTPLLIAAARPGAYQVAKLLVDHGANPSEFVGTYRGPMTPLRLAAEAGDKALLQLLLDRGADAKAFGGALPLIAAINASDPDCVKLTLHAADQRALNGTGVLLVPSFGAPATLRNPQAIKTFFKAGAEIADRDRNGRTLLMLAASSEDTPVETVEALIRLGADVNAITDDGRTALDFAQQMGRTPVAELLTRSGLKTKRENPLSEFTPKPAASVRAAVERSLPLLQRADVTFLKKSGCVSCHNNSLTTMTIAAAREAGISVDEVAARRQRDQVGVYIENWRERALQAMGIPGDSNTINYVLLGLAAADYPPDPATDALARYLKNDQMPEGRWRLIANRPPLGSSEFEVAAVALRALQVYAPKSRKAEYEPAEWRAADWLRSAEPKTTADRAFQLLGLTWAGDSTETLKKSARELLAEQRADGGWGQLPTMKTDAYATGQVLVALYRSEALTPADAAYQHGVEYLLSNQLEDGSWHVRSRSIPFQPYFESGFPHGPDQWISAAATNWATMALIPAVK